MWHFSRTAKLLRYLSFHLTVIVRYIEQRELGVTGMSKERSAKPNSSQSVQSGYAHHIYTKLESRTAGRRTQSGAMQMENVDRVLYIHRWSSTAGALLHCSKLWHRSSLAWRMTDWPNEVKNQRIGSHLRLLIKWWTRILAKQRAASWTTLDNYTPATVSCPRLVESLHSS
jgi:hypothetical protein